MRRNGNYPKSWALGLTMLAVFAICSGGDVSDPSGVVMEGDADLESAMRMLYAKPSTPGTSAPNHGHTMSFSETALHSQVSQNTPKADAVEEEANWQPAQEESFAFVSGCVLCSLSNNQSSLAGGGPSHYKLDGCTIRQNRFRSIMHTRARPDHSSRGKIQGSICMKTFACSDQRSCRLTPSVHLRKRMA